MEGACVTRSLRPGCVSARALMVPVSLRSGLAADRGRWRVSRMACPRGDRCARWDVHFQTTFVELCVGHSCR